MFKVAKLEKVDNEKVSINLVTQERNKYENGKVVLSETFKTLSFDISGGNYSFSFNLNSKLEDLLEIPMNETLDFKDYIFGGETLLNVRNLNIIEPKIDIKIKGIKSFLVIKSVKRGISLSKNIVNII